MGYHREYCINIWVLVMISDQQIELEARKLQAEVWKSREILHPKHGGNPLELLEPRLLAQVLGIDFNEINGLSDQCFPFRDKHFKTAGLIDRQQNLIAVEANLPLEVRRFTAAHECGHVVLHADEVIHRDRPLDGTPPNFVRPPKEKQADRFAAAYLMPEKQVRAKFEERFGSQRFVFSDAHVFHVYGHLGNQVGIDDKQSLSRELSLASSRSFGRLHFPSLAETFRVSMMAMALRIRELDLIQWP